MPTVATHLMTAEAFFDWVNRPENRDRHFELERGVVVEMSRPGERHGLVCANVVYVLNHYVRQRRKGAVLSNDTGIIWERGPDTVKGPDVVFTDGVRRYEDLNPRFTDRLPKLVVEVLSPNDRWSKVTRRINQFLRWGVPLVWVVDPEACDATVYRPDHDPYTIEQHQELTGDDVLPNFNCNAADIFFVAESEAVPPAPQPRSSRKKKR